MGNARCGSNRCSTRLRTIVSVPWGERAERRRYKGTVNEEYKWAVMPTSNCSPQPQTYFIDNTTPEPKLAYP